jgi:predicted nucleotidyltransferase
MADPEILSAVRKYLRALGNAGIAEGFGVLYGSHVDGRATEWSDIDLIVVSPDFDGDYTWEDVSRLWVLAGHVDSRIEPIPCGVREWDEGDDRAIIEIARRHGVRVTLDDAA